MSLLAARQQELQNCRNQLSAAEANTRQIESELAQIEALRIRLNAAREDLRANRTTARNVVAAEFANWRGDVRSKRFRNVAQTRLIERDYKAALNGVEITLDNIRSRKTILRDRLTTENNLVSRLRARISTLTAEIQNLINAG